MESGADRDMDSGTQKVMVGRRQLIELDQNRMNRGELVREAKKQAELGKWKRIARSELWEVVMETDIDKENNTSLGMKRSLHLIVWEGDLQQGSEIGKKQKNQQGEFNSISPQVGIASLEWPQFD